MIIETDSRQALRELIATLQEVDRDWVSEERNLFSEDDVAGAHRALMHMLEGGLTGMFESDPAHPQFRRIVTPSRKFTGDNSDAIYFDSPVSADHSYVIRGDMNGAVYFSMTIEVGAEDGGMANKTAGVINDVDMDIDSDGKFVIYLGGEPRERNWLPLSDDASRVTTRHYFELSIAAAADPACEPDLLIKTLDTGPAPAATNVTDVAAGIRRVINFVRSRTLDQPPMADQPQPAFVSLTPNEFPVPVVPGDFGLAAFDAHYSMAPYFLGPDEALEITGRWPDCRFANVCLWNRFQQSFDYANRQISLNRVQTELEEDGSFRMVIAHQDPGVANWIDTEGNMLGLVFWRYMLAEGDVETPQTRVVKLTDIR
jgi:hypothetical protein